MEHFDVKQVLVVRLKRNRKHFKINLFAQFCRTFNFTARNEMKLN